MPKTIDIRKSRAYQIGKHEGYRQGYLEAMCQCKQEMLNAYLKRPIIFEVYGKDLILDKESCK
jgi:hypothetical protein